MKFVFAVLVMCLSGAAAAAAAPPAQTLAIRIAGDGARATQLPAYDPSRPISIVVAQSGPGSVQSVTIDAVGPAGESQQVALARSAPGRFTGSLALAATGTWRLRLVSRNGALDTATTPVTLDVEAPPPSDAGWIGFAVGAGIFVVFGGGGFVLLRRLLHEPRAAELEQAA